MENAELTRYLARSAAVEEMRSWDVVVRQARHAGLLGRLAERFAARGELERIPTEVRRHLEGARLLALRQREAVHWEVQCIHVSLQASGVPPLLLKGAAYTMAGLPPALGRTLSDIDVLVPREALSVIEAALIVEGWATTHHDAYDQRYYREWMHELPPMQHVVRGTAIDVHHALLPLTARIKVDTEAMRAAAVPVPGHPELRMLAPADMVLHAATHLFHEGELDKGLRDLSDLDLLLRHFGQESGFWERLVPRAKQVGLVRPLFYALRYCEMLLATPVPAGTRAAISEHAPAAPLRALMDALFRRALQPKHPTAGDAWTPLARALLFLRGHWLRMPFPLLVRHLAHKALASFRDKRERGERGDANGGDAR